MSDNYYYNKYKKYKYLLKKITHNNQKSIGGSNLNQSVHKQLAGSVQDTMQNYSEPEYGNGMGQDINQNRKPEKEDTGAFVNCKVLTNDALQQTKDGNMNTNISKYTCKYNQGEDCKDICIKEEDIIDKLGSDIDNEELHNIEKLNLDKGKLPCARVQYQNDETYPKIITSEKVCCDTVPQMDLIHSTDGVTPNGSTDLEKMHRGVFDYIPCSFYKLRSKQINGKREMNNMNYNQFYKIYQQRLAQLQEIRNRANQQDVSIAQFGAEKKESEIVVDKHGNVLPVQYTECDLGEECVSYSNINLSNLQEQDIGEIMQYNNDRLANAKFISGKTTEPKERRVLHGRCLKPEDPHGRQNSSNKICYRGNPFDPYYKHIHVKGFTDSSPKITSIGMNNGTYPNNMGLGINSDKMKLDNTSNQMVNNMGNPQMDTSQMDTSQMDTPQMDTSLMN